MLIERERGPIDQQDDPDAEPWIVDHDPPDAESWGAFEEDAINEDDALTSLLDRP